jgi:membrane associated rhomboid family serine protease
MFFPYRDENPRLDVPYQTIGLIALNVGLFLVLNLTTNYMQIIRHLGLVPAHPSLLTAFTSQFLHAGLLHLLGNMWFLWLFGDNVEDALGPTWFLPFYLGCGFMAGVLHIVFATGASAAIPAIGASGAISGVLGAYLMLYPQARIACLCPIGFVLIRTSLRAVYFIGFWFFLQLLWGLITYAAGVSVGIAYWAHIGGFLFGAGLVWPIREQLRPAPATVASGPEGRLPAPEVREDELVQELQGYFANGRDARALESSVELTRRFPDADLPFETELQMAESLEFSGQFHLALIRYRHLLRRAGTRDRTAEVYRRLAALCRRLGRPGQAMTYLRKAQRLGAAVGDDIILVQAELQKSEIGTSEQANERYLIIQQTEATPSILHAARIIARHTGRTFNDTAITMRAFPGILAEGLDHATAHTVAIELQKNGIWVLIVPERLRAQPPPALALNRIDITPDGLACLPWRGERFFMPWRAVDLLACGGVHWRSQKVVDSLHTGTDDPNFEIMIIEPTNPVEETIRHYDVVTKKGVNWYLDIYGLDPPRHVRVDPHRFDFRLLEEHIATTQEHNFTLCVERLTRAAPDVPVTPGVVGLLVGEGQDRHTFQDMGHFERHAAWYLTRLRATKILHETTRSGVPAAV